MPTNALNFVSEQERERIEDAIFDAEQQTSAEIVCAISTESGRYDRAESIVGVTVALLLLALVNVISWRLSTPGGWGPPSGPSFLFQGLAVVAGFVLGSVLASHVHGLRRLVVSSAEIEAETTRSASHVFAEQKMGLTKNRGGLLIYVSLFERDVVILADRASYNALQSEGLGRIKQIAVEQLKAGNREAAFLKTVQASADLLKEKLPPVENDGNQLSNLLVCIHPRP